MTHPSTLRVAGLDRAYLLEGMPEIVERKHDPRLTGAELEAARADLAALDRAAKVAEEVAVQATAHANELRAELAETKKMSETASVEVAAGRLAIDEASAKLVRLPILEMTIPLAVAEARRLQTTSSDAAHARKEAANRVRLIEAARVFQELCEQLEALSPIITRYCALAWADGVLLRPARSATDGADK